MRGVPGRLAGRTPRATHGAPRARRPRWWSASPSSSLFTVFASSLRTGIDDEVSAGFGDADLVARHADLRRRRAERRRGARARRPARDRRGGRPRPAPVRLGDGNELVAVTDLAALAERARRRRRRRLTGRRRAERTWRSPRAGRARGLAVGSTVDATFVDGATETLTVAAVYADQQILGGFVLGQDVRAEHTPAADRSGVFMTHERRRRPSTRAAPRSPPIADALRRRRPGPRRVRRRR